MNYISINSWRYFNWYFATYIHFSMSRWNKSSIFVTQILTFISLFINFLDMCDISDQSPLSLHDFLATKHPSVGNSKSPTSFLEMSTECQDNLSNSHIEIWIYYRNFKYKIFCWTFYSPKFISLFAVLVNVNCTLEVVQDTEIRVTLIPFRSQSSHLIQ